jgi:hypothetical protein
VAVARTAILIAVALVVTAVVGFLLLDALSAVVLVAIVALLWRMLRRQGM